MRMFVVKQFNELPRLIIWNFQEFWRVTTTEWAVWEWRTTAWPSARDPGTVSCVSGIKQKTQQQTKYKNKNPTTAPTSLQTKKLKSPKTLFRKRIIYIYIKNKKQIIMFILLCENRSRQTTVPVNNSIIIVIRNNNQSPNKIILQIVHIYYCR